MINSEAGPTPSPGAPDPAVDEIVRAGSGGAITVAGIATAIVVALWFAFYLRVFEPRAPAQ
jgi:hypothetical protein